MVISYEYTMSRKKKRKAGKNPSHTRQHALDCIPVKSPEVKEKKDRSGELLLVYQVQVRPWFQGVLKKITRKESTLINKTLQLDSLGASVWKMIDGEQSVRKIIDEFQSVHQFTRREAEISVTAFFKELGKRGLLAMREK